MEAVGRGQQRIAHGHALHLLVQGARGGMLHFAQTVLKMLAEKGAVGVLGDAGQPQYVHKQRSRQPSALKSGRLPQAWRGSLQVRHLHRFKRAQVARQRGRLPHLGLHIACQQPADIPQWGEGA